MAELYFFMANEDAADFCRFLSNEFNCSYIEDGSPHLPSNEITDPVEASIAKDTYGYEARLFITSPLWTKYPLVLTKIEPENYKSFWSIAPRYGGPAFDFLRSRIISDEKSKRIISGWISDYPWYYLKRNDARTFDRPEAMTKAFNTIKNYVRRNGSRTYSTQLKKMGPWVLHHASDDAQNGTSLVHGGSEYTLKSK